MPIIQDIIKIQIISLKARKKAAQGYILNTKLQIECNLLAAQIRALEIELEKQKTDHNF